MSNLKKFTGQGIIFPIVINDKGRPNLETGFPLIRASLISIIRWPHATRFFLGQYGARIHELLEEPNDTILRSLVRHFILDSIKTFEKRISLLDIIVIRPRDGSISIKLKYKMINNSEEDNFIFPFYNPQNIN
jgi:hypothetical protein